MPSPPEQAPTPAVDASESAPESAPDPAQPEGPDAESKRVIDPRTVGPLAPAWTALERGDHVEARRLAQAVIDDSTSEITDKNDALSLLERMRPDVTILVVFGLTGALMVLLAIYYLGQHGAHAAH
ncbi:MAG: hypothetical protein Q8Q09_00620 [Deltaproteobacteria bacterium]|nr:hypothetical protein [Deltaproteobacteria bacterium]